MDPTRFLTPLLDGGRLTIRMEDERACVSERTEGTMEGMRTRLRRTQEVRSRGKLVVGVAARGALLEHVVAARGGT